MSGGPIEEARAAPALRAAGIAAPREAVLPVWGYALLSLEVAALALLHFRRPEQSGGEPVSYALGWTGLASMVVMHVYSLRRRIRALAGWGSLRSWLRFHIFLGLQGALLVTYHSLHLHNVRSIQGVNIVCVAIVVVSGIFGRYLYSLIPKSLSGERLGARQVEQELAELAADIDASAPPPALREAVAGFFATAEAPSARRSLGQLASQDLQARGALRELNRVLRSHQGDASAQAFARIARRRVMLSRRLVTLASAERVFRYWTILHKPLTFLLLAATALHILAHYMYSAGMSG